MLAGPVNRVDKHWAFFFYNGRISRPLLLSFLFGWKVLRVTGQFFSIRFLHQIFFHMDNETIAQK